MKELMLATVTLSTPEEIAQLLCDLIQEATLLREDERRLDWLRHHVSGREFRCIGICMDNSGDLDELRNHIDGLQGKRNDL